MPLILEASFRRLKHISGVGDVRWRFGNTLVEASLDVPDTFVNFVDCVTGEELEMQLPWHSSEHTTPILGTYVEYTHYSA